MKKYMLCCMICLMVMASVTGCSDQADQVETDEEIRIPDETDEEALGEAADLYEAVAEENLEELGEMVFSEDETYQVLVPSGWELCKNKIDETMMFEMQGETEDQYIGILVLDAVTYGELEIDAFMDAYAKNAEQQFENAVVSDKESIDINENAAYTLRISGAVDGVNYINHIYAVDYEGEKVIFTASMYVENETIVSNVLKDVVLSFKNNMTEETIE